MGTGSTRDRLLAGTLQVVAEQGIAKASARTIATEAGVNQALVFYHFGSVDELLVAACEHGARQRVEANREASAEVASLPELVAVARRLHETERAAGHVALLGQLLAGAPSHGPLAEAVAKGLGLWASEVELVLARLLTDTPVADFVDVPGWPGRSPRRSSASSCTTASTPTVRPPRSPPSNSSRPWPPCSPISVRSRRAPYDADSDAPPRRSPAAAASVAAPRVEP